MLKEGPSLRTTLAVTVGGLLLASLLTMQAVQYYVDQRREAATTAEDRELVLRADIHRHLISLLNQEVGVRAFLASGDERFLEAYDLGRQQEVEAALSLRTDLADFDAVIAERLAALEATAQTWRRESAAAGIGARRRGPIEDLTGMLLAGKTRFDAIRGAGDALRVALDERITATIASRTAEVRAAKRVELGALAAIALVSAAVIAWILRNTVTPIVRLAAAAQRGGFDEHASGREFREIDGLGRALVSLESQVREREVTLRRERGDADALRQFVEVVQQITSEPEVIETLVRTLRKRFEAREVRVLRYNASETRLDPAYPEMDAEERRRHLILFEPTRCRAVRTGASVRYDDAQADTACVCTLGVPARGSYLCAPMLAAGEIIGLVNVQSDTEGAWSPETKARIESYVASAAAALSGLSLLRAARESALRDGLTSAYNRRFLDEYLPKQIVQSARREGPMSALMIDIDHFKRFNDSFGHETGDRVLVAFARCLSRTVRGSDVVVRYGGEEFAIVLPDTKLDDAMMLAERLRTAIEGVSLDDPRLSITASVGVATYPTHGQDGESLLRAADAALYQSKTLGRNRVTAATPRGVA